MATIADLLIKLGIKDEATAGLKTFEKETDNAGTHSKTFASNVGEARESIVGHLGKIAAAAGVAGAVFEGGEFLKGGIEAAEGLTKANESLDTAIEKTGGNVGKLGPVLTKTAKDAADFGISQKDATLALAQATLMTGSAQAGQRAYEEAILLSKGAHISFSAALRATAKGQDGVTSGLTRYGVIVKKGATGVQQLAAIQKVWGGQAAANTLDSDRLSAKFQNMQASLGEFLLPAFLKFTVYIGDVIDGMVSLAHWVGRNSDIIAPLAAAIGAVVVAFVVWKAATAAWTAATELATSAQVALDAAMDANPIGLVILAIVALGAALAVLWLKSDGFRKAIENTWTTLKTSTIAVWDAIKDFLVRWWPLLLAVMTGGMSLVVKFVVDHWTQIRDTTSAVWNALRGIVMGAISAVQGVVSGGFNAVASVVTVALGRVHSVVSSVFGGLAAIIKACVGGVTAGIDALKGAFQPVEDVLHTIESMAESAASSIQHVIDIAGKVGGAVGAVKGAVGHLVPHFAGGVSNFGGGLALVGENGPELVNLPTGADVHTNAESRGMLGGGSGLGGGGGGDLVMVVDGQVLGRVARKELTRTGKRNVSVAFGTTS